MRRVLAIALVYMATAVVLTWPLALHLADRLGAPQDLGDPFLNLWTLGWGLHAWTSDPASVVSGRVFDANIYYPLENSLAYSDHLLLQALVLSPVYALTGNVVLCYNLLLIASIALSGVSMHALARVLSGSTSGAFLAGIAWAAWPYRTAHLVHLQLQALYFMPLALLCLHKVVAARRWRDVAALGAIAALQGIGSLFYGLVTAIALTASALTLALATGQWRHSPLWSRFAAAAVLAMLLVALPLIPYMRLQLDDGVKRTLVEAANGSASPASYVRVPPTNFVYGATGLLVPLAPAPGQQDRGSVEQQLFPGFVLLLLAAVGAWRGARGDARPLVTSCAALVTCGLLLSFGPRGVRPLYAMLFDHVYGFHSVRAPARFAVMAMLGLAPLAALGLREVMQRDRSAFGLARTILPVVALTLASLEYVNTPLSPVAAPPRTTAAGQWLTQEPTPGAVVHLPFTGDQADTAFMVQSLEHRRAIVNGYSEQRPAGVSELADSLSDLPSPEAFSTLRDLDVRFLVSPDAVAGAGHTTSPLVERARLPDGVIYELRWTPEAAAALADETPAAPPPPGVPRFAAGETSVYEIFWDGGPLNVAAGRARLTVVAGEASADRWQFDADAETADWVSSLFDARDHFSTVADRLLLPLEHRREIREGRRRLDEVYVFDRPARLVRMGDSARAARETTALARPLSSDAARDVLTALYYARTLPLEPGAIITIPINENGTNLTVQVNVGEMAAIEQRGSPVEALRLEPRLVRRIDRRRPLAMTLWLSADARRVPLRLVVDAGFGRLRADLVDYRP